MKERPPFTVVFFKEPNAEKGPVRKWFQDLNEFDRKIVGRDLMTLQWNWPMGMPLVKNLDYGIWELRSTLNNRIARVLFIVKQHNIFLLHAFIKKTQKTPLNELEIAHKRSTSIK